MIGKGQTNNGGTDAYVAKLDTKGNVVYEQQYGTSGNDSVGGDGHDVRRRPLCRQRA